ncbi:unnamed protein product [Lactuca virosa]|uniref:Uncharacterized protein n=1 Tax=Lactuca virosa TaxID=75947 RepID=A0AAU9PSY1_9ASTR|nr:unnamed protein product [Lactuca virosa]
MEINTRFDVLSKNVTQSFLKVFKKLDAIRTGFVNEFGPSFMKGGKGEHNREETHTSPPKNDDEKKIPEGAVIQTLSDDDENSSKKALNPPKSPLNVPSPSKSPPKSHPKAPIPPRHLGKKKITEGEDIP